MAFERVERDKSLHLQSQKAPQVVSQAKFHENDVTNAFSEYFKQLNQIDPLKEQDASKPRQPIYTAFRTEVYFSTKVTYNPKLTERRNCLLECRSNIAAKQERLGEVIWPLVLYLAMANFFSHMKGARFVLKRYQMLAALRMRLACLTEFIDNCLKSLRDAFTVFFMVKTVRIPTQPFNSGSSESADTLVAAKPPEEKETVLEETQSEDKLEESASATDSAGSEDMPLTDALSPDTNANDSKESNSMETTETESESGTAYDWQDNNNVHDSYEERLAGRVNRFVQHSDKAFSALENTIRAQMKLIVKRDEIFMKLESIESRMASKPTSIKVFEALQRVYQAIDLLDKMLDQSEPHLEGMADHVAGGLLGGIALAGVGVDISSDPMNSMSDDELDEVLKKTKQLTESQDKNMEVLDKDLHWADKNSDYPDRFPEKNVMLREQFQFNLFEDKNTIRPFNISPGMSPLGQSIQGNAFKAGCVNV